MRTIATTPSLVKCDRYVTCFTYHDDGVVCREDLAACKAFRIRIILEFSSGDYINNLVSGLLVQFTVNRHTFLRIIRPKRLLIF